MTVTRPGIHSGFATLDAALPDGGWPAAGVTQILIPRNGAGELRLLAPCLRQLTQTGRTVALLVPAYLSYAPTLIQYGIDLNHVRIVRSASPLEGMASIEADLQDAIFGAVVVWMPPLAAADANVIRTLQLAGRLSRCPVFLFSAGASHDQLPASAVSTAPLQLQVKSPFADTVQLQRIDPAKPNAHPVISLSLPAPLVRLRTRQAPPASGVAKALLVSQKAARPAPEARASLRTSLIHIAANIAASAASAAAAAAAASAASLAAAEPVPQAAGAASAPTRSPWPFKQRRRTPDTPVVPGKPSVGRLMN
ncbi:hypothetical protein GCM10007242_08860 [Pigmentiphaga litoralis]|uniref:hypothetical protein n=1 Tax=Pigmentiphaga litoralis TaxID=516702 RepID=UPI001679927C|nr:hypothetical protein [Pigmentiphaga litoralis]GGX05787.1 hypothetical protein GCM10007242_08860 [Pigmentiphaga litoralis]